MKLTYFLPWLLLSVLLSACAATRGAGEIVQGREALLAGNYQAALGYFQQAEHADPNYIYGAELREGVRAFWAEPNTSPGTIRKRARLCKQHFPNTGATMLHGYTLA